MGCLLDFCTYRAARRLDPTSLVKPAFHGGWILPLLGILFLPSPRCLRGCLRLWQWRQRAAWLWVCWGCWSTWACMAPVYRATEATIAAFRLLVGRTPDSRARDATLANCARYGSRRLLLYLAWWADEKPGERGAGQRHGRSNQGKQAECADE